VHSAERPTLLRLRYRLWSDHVSEPSWA